MRILSVHAGFGPGGGGAGERNYQMCRHLLAAGEDVRMLITDKFLVDGLTSPDYPFPKERLEVLSLMNRRYNIPRPARKSIDRVVAGCDVIHLMGHLTALAPGVCAAARRWSRPWVVCTAGSLPILGRSRILKQAFQAAFGTRILREAARLIAITRDEQKLIAGFGPVTFIPNAFEPSSSAPAQKRTVTDENPFILYLGGFHPTKGPDLLIEAFARTAQTSLQGVRLVMAGPHDELREDIEVLARTRGIAGRVAFPGFLAPEEKSGALARCSFVVIPSRRDAMTLVVLEAAAAEKPVLMTHGCGFPEAAATGGALVVDASVDDLTRGLESMASARARWKEMGERIHSLVAEYSWERMTPVYRQMFREVAG